MDLKFGFIKHLVMPLFMDFHKLDSAAITQEDVYRAHLRDVAMQNKHGLIYKRYYLNLPQKTAFCLMEGPDMAACIESHREAHGVGACNVIEVSREHEFLPYLGEGSQNEQDLALTLSGEVDSGFRTILLVRHLNLDGSHEAHIHQLIDVITECKGSIIKLPSEVIMISFVDAFDAITCAGRISRIYGSSSPPDLYSLAIATGKPVDEHGRNLFEKTKAKARIMSILGFQNGVYIDLETKLSASVSRLRADTGMNGMTVLDETTFSEVEQLTNILSGNIGNPEFKNDQLSKLLGMSKTQAYRKITALTGMPPIKFFNEIRLLHAADALKAGNKTVAEISYDLGFNSPSYFTRVFRDRFRLLPTKVHKSK